MLDRLEIVKDPLRLSAAIEGMAQLLADVLVLKDDSMAPNVHWDVKVAATTPSVPLSAMREEARRKDRVAAARCPPLGQLMDEELAYKATQEQESYLKGLAERYDHATKTIFVSCDLLQDCGDLLSAEWSEVIDRSQALEGANVSLAPYSNFSQTPLFFRYRYPRPNGETVTVGAIATLLANELETLLTSWLHECDKTFCDVQGEIYQDTPEISKLVGMLAKALARKHALLTRPGSLDINEGDIAIDPRFLQCRAECEFARNRCNAECRVKQDAQALQALAIIARDGGETVEAKEVILKQSQQLARFIDAPARELGLSLENTKRMNLLMLRRVFKDDLPFVVRCQCASSWSQQHGGWAQTATAQAIKLLEDWRAAGNATYITMATQERGKGVCQMPPNPAAAEEMIWFALPPSLKRDGLDSHGKRVVWLTSWVWQRIGHPPGFEDGVVRKDILVNVAMESLHQAQLMREIVDNERLRSNQGVRLRMFENSLNNPSSDLAPKIDISMCRLSGFSLNDIGAVFEFKPLRDLIMTDLTKRTRLLVSESVIPLRYETFAMDALTLLLPSIKGRRQAHGLHANLATHPISDLLRTIPKIGSWSPLNGQLKIDLLDLRAAHPALRSVLEHHSKTEPGVFVSQTDAGSHRKTEFVFDSVALVQLLKM